MIWARRLISPLLAVCLFAGILAFVEHAPYVYLALTLFVILIFSAAKSNNSSIWKPLLVNLAAIILAIGLAEAYFAGWSELGFSPRLAKERFLLGPNSLATDLEPFISDEVRGYALPKNARIRSLETLGPEKIYDVIYTSNLYGLRISPHDLYKSATSPEDSKNLVFFGGSYTFGEGVQDYEAWPYLVEEKSGGRYRSYNFAMEGYGPHQMLRMLQTGFIDTVNFDKKPVAAFYLAFPRHMIRSSCKYPYFTWDVHGPRYKVNLSGQLEYAGKFDDNWISKIKFLIFKQLAKSHLIINSFWLQQLLGWTPNLFDKEKFIKIILQAQKIFTQKYGNRFYMILWASNIWSDESAEYKYIVSELNSYHINVIETKDIFDSYDNHKDRNIYQIKHDGHPNKLAHEKIAEYVLNYIDRDLNKVPYAQSGSPFTLKKK
jgi:hypothetical protein